MSIVLCAKHCLVFTIAQSSNEMLFRIKAYVTNNLKIWPDCDENKYIKPASYFSFILLVAEIADKVLPSTCAEFSVTDEGK